MEQRLLEPTVEISSSVLSRIKVSFFIVIGMFVIAGIIGLLCAMSIVTPSTSLIGYGITFIFAMFSIVNATTDFLMDQAIRKGANKKKNKIRVYEEGKGKDYRSFFTLDDEDIPIDIDLNTMRAQPRTDIYPFQYESYEVVNSDPAGLYILVPTESLRSYCRISTDVAYYFRWLKSEQDIGNILTH